MNYIELDGGACQDCVIAIANDDYSGMDGATEARVRAGIARINEHLIVGDEIGFLNDRCAVCGALPGDRHAVGYLAEGDDDEPEDDDDEPEEDDESESDEPDEDSITTRDDRHFYQYGKTVLTIGEDDDLEDALVAYMNREQFWPDCWSISDHGNAHRIDLAEAYRKAEAAKAEATETK